MNLGEINAEVGKLNSWSLQEGSIVKNFGFDDFVKAMEFVNKVAEIAEKHSHHPDIMINYNQVRLSLSTHSVKGLTVKDFEVARDIDMLS